MACQLFVSLTGLTGDCSNTNSGSFGITIDGTAPDYSIQWISPYTGTTALGAGVTAYTQSSLSAGTYTFNVIDSCISGNTYFPFNVNISSGTCVSILDHSNTSCGFNNGTITAATTNLYFISTYYLYELTSGFIASASTEETSFTFTSLSAGTYYLIADDGGGCTGKTESCIIKSSTTLNFGLYQVNNSACAVSLGSLHVTGLTGTPPYTYLWTPNGETTSSITGLSDGTYAVTVTDGLGCETTQGAIIGSVPVLNTIMITDIEPTCFSANGEATLYISGGTAPYHIQASNGEIVITFATSYTFTGLPASYFSAIVTDAGLCQSTATTTLLTPSAISVVSVNLTNSNCNNNDGEMSISLFGGAAPYTFTLIDSLGNSQNGIQPTQNAGFLFTNLASDTYTLQITDSLGLCTYSQSFTISNNVLYTLSATPTSTTCNLDNGSVLLTISSGGTAPYRYQIDGYDILGVTGNTYLFQNLYPGNYTATVTDANLCKQILPFTITNLSNIDFVLASVNPLFGPSGEISVFITDGTPPFTINWSSNVNGQTGLTVNNLSAGTYSVTITDSYGCVQTRNTTLSGYNLLSSSETYTICQGPLIDLGLNIRKGPQQMLIDGFKDLTSGDTNCILNQAIFEVNLTLSGTSATTTAQTFYTATTLNDFPGDDDYYNTLKLLLLSYSGISEVIIQPVENVITIATICNPTSEYVDADVIAGIKIYYDISCVECAGPVEVPYIFEVDVSLAGSSGPGKFQLPLEVGGSYDLNVDWGDGNFDVINTWNDPLTEHTYTSASTYTIKIIGQLSGWTFNNGGDKEKMVEVKQWGILELGDSPGGFYGCNNLVLSGVTDFINLSTTSKLDNTFTDCFNVTSINNIEYWDTSTITSMINIFQSTQFNQDISSWDVSNVIDMSFMFNGTQFNQDISSWDVSNVINMSAMFLQTPFNQPLNDWDVSNVTNMFAMFNISSFDQDISSWDVSNVTDMSSMFSSSPFNQPLSAWNVSNVINMAGMFSNTPFNQSIDNWDVSSVTNMSLMFNSSSFNQPLSSWNLSNVVDISSMFDSAPFDQDINSWDVSNVLNMGGTFFNSSFNQPLSGWNVSSVIDMDGMFQSSLFNQDISSWNVINVFNMRNMFNNSVFNQNISSWNVSNVSNMLSMLDNCSMNQTNYEALLVGWNSLPSLQTSVTLGANGLQYQIGSAADTARSNIIASYTWTFVGDIAVP